MNGSLGINGRAGEDEKEAEPGHQLCDPWGAFIVHDWWKWEQIKTYILLALRVSVVQVHQLMEVSGRVVCWMREGS